MMLILIYDYSLQNQRAYLVVRFSQLVYQLFYRRRYHRQLQNHHHRQNHPLRRRRLHSRWMTQSQAYALK